MNVSPDYSAKAMKIVFAVFMLLYVVVIALIYVVDWDHIYVFTDSPEVVLLKKRKANALRQIVKHKQHFLSAFAKIDKKQWLKYQSTAYHKLVAFAKTVEDEKSPERLLAFKKDLQMNALLLTHYTKIINSRIAAEQLKIAKEKARVARLLKIKKDQEALQLRKLIEKRTDFLDAVSSQVKYRTTWEKVAKKQYDEITRVVNQVRGLDTNKLGPYEKDIDAAFIKLNYYKNIVKVARQKAEATVKKTDKANAVPILLNSKSFSNSTQQKKSQSKLSPKVVLEKIEMEYNWFLKIRLYDSTPFLASYKRISAYLIDALKSPLSTPQVERTLSIKKEVEQRRIRAEQVAHALMGLKIIKVNEKELSPQYLADADRAGYPIEVVNNLGIHFRFIPAGTFLMGSPEDESGRDADELQHKVKISKPFYMQVSEISPKQFAFRNDPDLHSVAMVKVTQKMAIDYCRKLNQKSPLAEHRYDLPTEAQWEYACRATTTGPHYAKELKEIAFYDYGYSGKIGKRARLKPNAWGLYDMLGNAKEICRDQASSSFFFTKPPKTYQNSGTIIDPVGSDGSEMVLRGGGWTSSEGEVRAANREVVDAAYKLWDTGFRIIYKLD